MKHSFLDRYSDGKSVIHRLDPRTKFLVILVFILVVVITPPGVWYAFLFYFTVIAVLIGLSGVPPVYILKRSLYILPFAGLVAISLPFVRQGEIATSVNLWHWRIAVTYPGLENFGTILAKAWLSALSLILLMSTTRVTDLLKGMERLHLPRVMLMILSFMYRYIFVLTDEALRMMQARDSRSVGGRFMFRARTLGNMIGTLFIRSYEHSERVYSAMVARGYDGEVRTLRQGKFTVADGVFGIGMGLILILSSCIIKLVI